MNNTILPYQPNFRANIDEKLLDAAHGYLKKRSANEYKQFRSAIRRFHEVPNSDHLTIAYKRGYENGQEMHSLCAIENGKEPIVLSKKDQFRKLVQKFLYMNEYEFKTKTGLIQK